MKLIALYRLIVSGVGAARLAGQSQRDATNSPGCRGVPGLVLWRASRGTTGDLLDLGWV